MVSRRNYAAITAVMAIIFFLFQFLNMAKDHWNDYSENQYAVDVNELSGADNVYVASDSEVFDAVSDEARAKNRQFNDIDFDRSLDWKEK